MSLDVAWAVEWVRLSAKVVKEHREEPDRASTGRSATVTTART